MKPKALILCLLTTLLIGSCSQYKNVTLNSLDVKQFNMSGLTSAKVRVQASVDNPTKNPITLTDVIGTVRLEGKDIATFTLQEPVTFDAGGATTSEGVLLVKLTGVLNLLAEGLTLGDDLLSRVRVDMVTTFNSGGMTVKKKWKDVPAEELINM